MDTNKHELFVKNGRRSQLSTKSTAKYTQTDRTIKLMKDLKIFLANKKKNFMLFMCFMVNFCVAMNGYPKYMGKISTPLRPCPQALARKVALMRPGLYTYAATSGDKNWPGHTEPKTPQNTNYERYNP